MKIKNWSSLLITATILIQVVRYMGTFLSSDVGQVTGTASDVLTFFLALAGLGMGILDTLGGALLFDGWRRVMPQAGKAWSFKFKVLTTVVFGLVGSGLIILVPFTISRMTHESIVDALGGSSAPMLWVWASMVNAIPYFLIAGIFAGNKMISDLESGPASENTSATTSRNGPQFQSTSGNGSRTGRPSIHESRVFEYLEKVLSEEGRVASFNETQSALGLPDSTISRIRNSWITKKQQEANR